MQMGSRCEAAHTDSTQKFSLLYPITWAQSRGESGQVPVKRCDAAGVSEDDHVSVAALDANE